MGKFWLITKLFKMIKDNPSIVSDVRDLFKGRGRSSEDRTKDLRELEISMMRLESRIEVLEKTVKKTVTAAFVIAGVAAAALILAIIRLV